MRMRVARLWTVMALLAIVGGVALPAGEDVWRRAGLDAASGDPGTVRVARDEATRSSTATVATATTTTSDSRPMPSLPVTMAPSSAITPLRSAGPVTTVSTTIMPTTHVNTATATTTPATTRPSPGHPALSTSTSKVPAMTTRATDRPVGTTQRPMTHAPMHETGTPVGPRPVPFGLPSVAPPPVDDPATSGPTLTGSLTTKPPPSFPARPSPVHSEPPTVHFPTPAPPMHSPASVTPTPTSASSMATPPVTTKPPTASPVTAPVTMRPTASAPATPLPPSSMPTTKKPITSAPAGTSVPATDKPVTNSPSTQTPTASASVTNVPATAMPVTTRPVTTHPVTSRPNTARPVTTGPVTREPTTTKPVTTQPATTKLATARPVTARPVTTKPVTTKPVTTKPVTTTPVTTKPVSTRPTTSKPTTTKPPAIQPPTRTPIVTPPFPWSIPSLQPALLSASPSSTTSTSTTKNPQAAAHEPPTLLPSPTPTTSKASVSPTSKPPVSTTSTSRSTPPPTLKSSPDSTPKSEATMTPKPTSSTKVPSSAKPATAKPQSANTSKTNPPTKPGSSTTADANARSPVPPGSTTVEHGGESDNMTTPSTQPSAMPKGTLVAQTDQARRPQVEITEDFIIIDDGTNKDTYQRYKRDKSETPPATKPPELEEPSSPGQDSSRADAETGPNVIVGGRNRDQVVPGADVEVSLLARKTQEIMQSVCGGFTISIAVLLVLFQLLALYSPDWLPRHRGGTKIDSLSAWLSPNAWELLVVFTYFQHIGSISMMDLPKAPHFVLDFTDSFSWTNFNFGSVGSGETRRLEFMILTGMVSYANRRGLQEGKLLAYTTRCFFIAVAVIVTSFFLALLWQRCCMTRHRATGGSSHGFALGVLGLATALWMLSVYPLSATSSFELRMQLKYAINGDLSIILFNLVCVVLGGTVVLVRRVQLIRADDAMDYRYVAVFGTLYADAKRNARFFFGLFVLFQTATGVCVGAIDDGSNQLIHQLGLHGGYIVALIVVRPYHQVVVTVLVTALMVLRMVNLILATAFVTTNTIPTDKRGSYANALVFSNFIVILAILFRQFLVFIYVLRMWSTTGTVKRSHAMVDEDGDYNITDTFVIPPHLENTGEEAPGFPPPSSLPSPRWDASSAISEVESPVPNLANRPIQSPFRYEYVVTKK